MPTIETISDSVAFERFVPVLEPALSVLFFITTGEISSWNRKSIPLYRSLRSCSRPCPGKRWARASAPGQRASDPPTCARSGCSFASLALQAHRRLCRLYNSASMCAWKTSFPNGSASCFGKNCPRRAMERWSPLPQVFPVRECSAAQSFQAQKLEQNELDRPAPPPTSRDWYRQRSERTRTESRVKAPREAARSRVKQLLSSLLQW
jgi:hypothetical protein